LPISRFEPVLVEASLGFVAARTRFGSISLCPAMGKPVACGDLLGLAAFLPLPRTAKVDKFAHHKLGGNQVMPIEAIQASGVCK
jgi:hypothetical protein